MNISLSPFAPEDLVSRDGFGRPVPRQPAHYPHSGWIWCLLTGFLPISAAASISLCQPPPGQSRVDHVTQLRTDGIHCRESAGTGPVVLKVVPVTGANFSGISMDQLMCASLFPHRLLVRSGHVRWSKSKKRGNRQHRDRHDVCHRSPRCVPQIATMCATAAAARVLPSMETTEALDEQSTSGRRSCLRYKQTPSSPARGRGLPHSLRTRFFLCSGNVLCRFFRELLILYAVSYSSGKVCNAALPRAGD